MVNKIRVFKGATELNFITARYTKSEDQVVDSASMGIESDTNVEKASIIDFTEEDGSTTLFSPKVIQIEKKQLWEIKMLSRGYELSNLWVENVYENQSPESIVEDIIDNYSQNLTYTSTETSGITLSKYIAKGYAIDIIKDMMILLEWQIRIDVNNNFYFEPSGNVDNGRTLIFGGTNGTFNIESWHEDDTYKFNRVRVKGQIINHFTQETANGTGSKTVFSLLHKPAGTVKVTVGGVEKTAGPTGSGDYDVDVENKTITFFSAPPNGTNNVVFDYAFQLPIIVEDQDDDAISADEEIFKKIEAPFIDNFADARKYAANLITEFSTGQLKVKGYLPALDFTIDVGELVTVNDTLRNRTDQLVVKKITYDMAAGKTKLEIGSRQFVFFDWQREVEDRVKKLERRVQDVEELAVSRTMKHDVDVDIKVMQNVEWNQPNDTGCWDHITLGRWRPDLNHESDCSDSTNEHNGTWAGSGIDGSQYEFTDVFANLVSYWKLNEAESLATVTDSKGSHNGTATGTTRIDGKFGYGRSFNGSGDTIVVSDHADFDVTNITMEFWIKTTSNDMDIIRKWESAGDERSWAFIVTSGGLARLTTSSDGTDSTLISSNSITRIDDGSWHHVVGTYDGTNQKIYIDGVLEDTDAQTALYQSNSDIKIADSFITSNDFNGSLDNLRFFSDDITAEQVLELYDQSGLTNYRSNYGIFNGSDRYITTPDHSDLDGGTNFSISLAIKMVTLPGAETWLMNKYDGSDGWGIRINASDQVELFYTNGTVDVSFNTNTTLNTGKFDHITFTKAGTALIAYINGVSVNTSTASHGTISANTNAFEVGRYSTNYFGDNLDEVQIFNKTLDATEVLNISNKIEIRDDLVLWWSMDNPKWDDRFTTKREWSQG